MSNMTRSALAVAAAALMTGGCATGYESTGDEGYVERGPATIDVSNHNWSDMNIYLIMDGTRRRLGTVMSQGRERFRIPEHMMAVAGRMHLLADPIGSRQTYLSAPIMIHWGQQLEWRLENSIQLSSLQVR